MNLRKSVGRPEPAVGHPATAVGHFGAMDTGVAFLVVTSLAAGYKQEKVSNFKERRAFLSSTLQWWVDWSVGQLGSVGFEPSGLCLA